MKEDAQKSLETLIYKSHQNTAIFIQTWVRGRFARNLYKKMLAARKTMGRIFLHIAIKLRWRKMITNKRNEIRDARRKIKKFYRRRYFHFKFMAEIDSRIH
jgi:murein endopeptidase